MSNIFDRRVVGKTLTEMVKYIRGQVPEEGARQELLEAIIRGQIATALIRDVIRESSPGMKYVARIEELGSKYINELSELCIFRIKEASTAVRLVPSIVESIFDGSPLCLATFGGIYKEMLGLPDSLSHLSSVYRSVNGYYKLFPVTGETNNG